MFTGNREFNEIYEKYKNLVLKAAYMYSGDNSDAAEDITQDTFLKLYVNFEELKRGKNMKDKDCLFCKIASGELPSATLYEDEDFRVILDLGPASKGHALILPKEHYRNLYDIDENLAAKAIVLAKKMVKKMTDVLGCDGYNIVQNNEEPAGQTVFHFHIHLIPRYKGDNVGLGWNMGKLTDEVRDEILDKMK